MKTEDVEIQFIFNGAQAVANRLSESRQHILAMQVTGVIQLSRMLRTRLEYPQPGPVTALDEAVALLV